jgi:hypothetical protein
MSRKPLSKGPYSSGALGVTAASMMLLHLGSFLGSVDVHHYSERNVVSVLPPPGSSACSLLSQQRGQRGAKRLLRVVR